jgi:hypothetical protein
MRPVRPGDGINRSRRLSTNFRPPAPVAQPLKPYTQIVGDNIRGIPPTPGKGGGRAKSFKLGVGINLGERKLGT